MGIADLLKQEAPPPRNEGVVTEFYRWLRMMRPRRYTQAFNILGLAKHASMGEIEKAFRRQAKDCHPDRFFQDDQRRDAEARFKTLSEAYHSACEFAGNGGCASERPRPIPDAQKSASQKLKAIRVSIQVVALA